jgi:hypothetical protein
VRIPKAESLFLIWNHQEKCISFVVFHSKNKLTKKKLSEKKETYTIKNDKPLAQVEMKTYSWFI